MDQHPTPAELVRRIKASGFIDIYKEIRAKTKLTDDQILGRDTTFREARNRLWHTMRSMPTGHAGRPVRLRQIAFCTGYSVTHVHNGIQEFEASNGK